MAEPSQLGRGFPQYTAGAWAHGTAGPPPFENVVPGITAPLSHIMLVARGAPFTVVMSADRTRRWNMLARGNPGTWYCPKFALITSDGVPPNEATSFVLCEYLTPRWRLTFRDRIASPPASISIPWLSTWPMFWNCTPGNPSDGSAGTDTSASLVFLLYHVNSSATRSSRSEASRPASISSPISGLRSILPR